MTVRLYIPDLPKTSELLPYLVRIDETAHYTNFGPLEREFASRMSSWIDPADPPEIVTFSLGTDALVSALRALGIASGARVLAPALTFPATIFAIQAAGLTSVLADVDPITWQLTPQIAARWAGRFEAVVPVAAFGAPMITSDWDAFAAATGAPVVIDAAAALLHRLRPKLCAVVYSLHATKPFGIGEGGLVVTSDRGLAATAKRLSNFGFETGGVSTPSGNAKMSEYHAAVGLAQLARISGVETRLRDVLAFYDRLLPKVPRQSGLPANLIISIPNGAAELAGKLAEAGVKTRRWYQPDIAAQPAFQNLAHAGSLEVCRALRESLLGLPFHTRLTKSDVLTAANLVRSALGVPDRDLRQTI